MGERERKYTGNIHEGLEERIDADIPLPKARVRSYARMFVFANPNLFYSDRSISREPELHNYVVPREG